MGQYDTDMKIGVQLVVAYLCADVNMDYNESRFMRDKGEGMSGAQSHHLIWTSNDPDIRLFLVSTLGSLPLEFFQEGRVIIPPIDEGMSNTSLDKRPQENRSSSHHFWKPRPSKSSEYEGAIKRAKKKLTTFVCGNIYTPTVMGRVIARWKRCLEERDLINKNQPRLGTRGGTA